LDDQIESINQLLDENGLGSKPSKSKIQEFRKKREAQVDAEGIDQRNIISSGGRSSRTRRPVSYKFEIKLGSDDEGESEVEEHEEEEEEEEEVPVGEGSGEEPEAESSGKEES